MNTKERLVNYLVRACVTLVLANAINPVFAELTPHAYTTQNSGFTIGSSWALPTSQLIYMPLPRPASIPQGSGGVSLTMDVFSNNYLSNAAVAGHLAAGTRMLFASGPQWQSGSGGYYTDYIYGRGVALGRSDGRASSGTELGAGCSSATALALAESWYYTGNQVFNSSCTEGIRENTTYTLTIHTADGGITSFWLVEKYTGTLLYSGNIVQDYPSPYPDIFIFAYGNTSGGDWSFNVSNIQAHWFSY